MIRKAKTDPFFNQWIFICPCSNWNAHLSYCPVTGRGGTGVWSILLPHILQQDVWPVECYFHIPPNRYSKSAFSDLSIWDCHLGIMVSHQTKTDALNVSIAFHTGSLARKLRGTIEKPLDELLPKRVPLLNAILTSGLAMLLNAATTTVNIYL